MTSAISFWIQTPISFSSKWLTALPASWVFGRYLDVICEYPPQGWSAQTQTPKAAEQQHHQFCCPPCIQRWQLFSPCLGGGWWLWWHQRGGGARRPGELVIGAVGGVQGAHELGQMDDLWHMLQWAGCILQVCREDIQNILFPLAHKDND